MAAFQILPTATRQPGQVRTEQVVVPAPPENTGMFRVTLDALDLLNEPDTTQIVLTLERSPDNGQTWILMAPADWTGNNGVPRYKPYHHTISTDGIVGQLISGTITPNVRLRFGVMGEWV